MAGHRPSSSRDHLRSFVSEAALRAPAGALVLDAGAGDAPYAELFAHTQYETADFTKSDRVYVEQTYVCDLTAIPVEDGRYDVVVCSQVLEHVPTPRDVVAELARVTKPGGTVWMSAPLFYEEHEQPYDFHRYTQYGLGRLAEDAGLVVDRVHWLEGYLGTLGYQARMASGALPTEPGYWGGSRVWAACARAARPVLWRLGQRLDAFDTARPYQAGGMPKNYAMVATKAPVRAAV